ncbi:MAG: prepilin-type N-terminal cleavage/methylation domain-containing protein [Candidatus Peribacteria bacterium]|jgi:Tfp pilus assembly protein PilV|nr:prepilin-type N-terminal cleavage/methylation domain-containing protein [Candidatus Peribacteria bacterium]
MKQKIFAFTLVEVIIALTLFSFVIIGVIFVVTRSYRYVENAKMQVMAVNLAREGVEMMYTIRDTNWRKYSGDKDTHRLRADPF